MKKNYKRTSVLLFALLFSLNIFAQNDVVVSNEIIDFGDLERGYLETKTPYSIKNNGTDTAFITYTHSDDPFFNENGYSFIAPGDSINIWVKIDRSFAAGSYSKNLYVETSLNDVSFDVNANIIDNTPVFDGTASWFSIGTGNNYAILVVDFNDGLENESIAFKYRFSGTVTAEHMITDISAAYPQLTHNIATSGLLTEVSINDHSGVDGNPDFWLTMTRTESTIWELNWGMVTIIDNGEWFGCSYTGYDSDYNPLNLVGNPVFIGYPTGINNITETELEIFPNPVSDNICIKTENSLIESIQITDISGKIIKNEILPTGTKLQWLNISDLSQGIYQIKVFTNGATECRKLNKI